MLWLSSSVFVEIIDAMNAILGIKESRPFWKRRLLAAVVTLSEAAILIATMVTTLAWPQILNWLGMDERLSIVATAAHAIVISVMVFFCFTLALLTGPDTDQYWEWTIPGSLLGTVVLLVVSFGFRVYAQHWGGYSATYGSLAGIIVLMTWLWLCSVVLLVAAELNRVIQDASVVEQHDGHGLPSGQVAALERASASSPLPARLLEHRYPSDGDLRLPHGARKGSPVENL